MSRVLELVGSQGLMALGHLSDFSVSYYLPMEWYITTIGILTHFIQSFFLFVDFVFDIIEIILYVCIHMIIFICMCISYLYI